MPIKNSAYLLTAAVILFWGTSATAFKIALGSISPTTLLWTSSFVSLIVLAVLVVLNRKLSRISELSAHQWLSLLALGAINPFLYYIILFQAYDMLPGQVAMSLNYLWPVTLALLSVPILKHSLTLKGLFSILLSFSGAMIIATQGDFSNWNQLNLNGIILALLSTVVWAIYWLFNAKLPIDAEIKLFIGFIPGSICAALFAYINGELTLPTTGFPWAAVIYIGIFEMGLTFFIWLKALQLATNAAALGNFIYITPFISLIILSTVINEEIYTSTLYGLFLIICGIMLQQYLRLRDNK